jgi:hypothetical protein
MPHLTLPLTAQGCAVTLFVNVSAERRAALRAAGQPIPLFVQITALIDTGASCTAIDADQLLPLALTPTGIAYVHTPSTSGKAAQMPQFDVTLGITHPSGNNLSIETVPIIAIPNFQRGGISALVGRDVLAGCLFIYNGTENSFTLGF